jgi:2-amino-4-hydroxy-6-hydroxymethyldihydropteridine diphosphokinase
MLSNHNDRDVNETCVHDVWIGMGSNLGERLLHLNKGIEAIERIAVGPVDCSAVYETTPVGFLDQPDFLNLVAHTTVRLSPSELLDELMRIELECGRIRTLRYGPRTLDLDILFYDDLYVCYQNLQIPHPRIRERGFVVIPLADLHPSRRLLGGETARELADKMMENGEVQYVGRFW